MARSHEDGALQHCLLGPSSQPSNSLRVDRRAQWWVGVRATLVCPSLRPSVIERRRCPPAGQHAQLARSRKQGGNFSEPTFPSSGAYTKAAAPPSISAPPSQTICRRGCARQQPHAPCAATAGARRTSSFVNLFHALLSLRCQCYRRHQQQGYAVLFSCRRPPVHREIAVSNVVAGETQ